MTSSILIVEDEPTVRENLEEILKFKGFTVYTAVDGKEGYEIAQRKEPDLIVSDVMMPVMDGFELLQKIRENKMLTHIPVILLTAKTMTEDRIQGLEYGADDYISKPFDMKELIARINNILELRRKLRAKVYLESADTVAESAHDVFMRELLEIFEKHMENSHFAIENVVVEMGLSKSTIQRRVKTITDKTFNQLLREFRLEQAKKHLERKVGNISEVAFMVGFNSVSYFSYSFKNYFGFSPTEVE